MSYLPEEGAVHPSIDEASCFTTGTFAHGDGIASLRQNITFFLAVTSVLYRFIRRVLPKHKFTAVKLARNQITLTYRNSFNEPCNKNTVVPLQVFQEGHVWVQSLNRQWPYPDLSQSESSESLG